MEKWVTDSIYVDVDTGEIINKIKTKIEYIIINKTSKIRKHDRYKSKEITYECRRNQYRIEY